MDFIAYLTLSMYVIRHGVICWTKSRGSLSLREMCPSQGRCIRAIINIPILLIRTVDIIPVVPDVLT